MNRILSAEEVTVMWCMVIAPVISMTWLIGVLVYEIRQTIKMKKYSDELNRRKK